MRYYETTADLLRVDDSGTIEQYDIDLKMWRPADSGMSGIYSGDIECTEISKAEADKALKRWAANAD
jgi:hypothetical protein